MKVTQEMQDLHGATSHTHTHTPPLNSHVSHELTYAIVCPSLFYKDEEEEEDDGMMPDHIEDSEVRFSLLQSVTV